MTPKPLNITENDAPGGADGQLLSPAPMDPPLPPSVASQQANDLYGSRGPEHLRRQNSLSQLSDSPFPDYDEDKWTMPHRSTIYMIWLTLVMAGIQIAWSVELAYISPYLLSLGVAKSTLSLIWVAGPVSGVIVQPLIGMMSDRSTFKWGRRRLFIVVSTAWVIAGFLGMGRTREIVSWWTGRISWESIRQSVIVLAVASLIVLDLAINATTAAARALIVDCVPTSQQNTANAWAGRMIGVGNVVGYLSGYINLPKFLPSLGETQFQILCILAPILLVVTVIITCVAIREVDPALLFILPGQEPEKIGVISAIRTLASISRLPRRVRQICNIQFFAWIVLIWNTTYTGEIYVRTYLRTHPPPDSRREEDQLWDNATRIASFALLLESFVSLVANLILPLFLRGTLAIPGLTLRRLWLSTHLLFAFLMWSTLFISSVSGAVTMVSAAGISWALTLWAPFALIAQCVSHINDVSRRESIASSRAQTPDLRPTDEFPSQATLQSNISPLSPTGISITNPDERERRSSESTPLLAPQPRPAEIRPSLLNPYAPQPQPKKEEITSAGAIMGLHNVFISSPQFISTLLASIIFHFLGAGGRGDDIHSTMEPSVESQSEGSIAWVLRVGGLGGFIAAYLTWTLAEEADAFGPTIGN